ncbi:MAG: ChaN family lipoprotein [Aquificaceae bacterium]|nr:ChaN family lipoprotein [Aquificaceae bacterium]MDW8237190.1 ChaN family lipoprotein [Aquificaceae bacterium]
MFLVYLFLVFISCVWATEIQNHRVVFLPEVHTSKEDHKFQLQVISSFDGNAVIAMEMFQHRFQKVLDDFVNGLISEEKMLELSEYKKRWGFDPELYRDIWNFARSRKIRIYAIGMDSELLPSVRRGESIPGLPSEVLLKPSKKEIEVYESVLKEHPPIDREQFYRVQSAWDAFMAYKIYEILEKEPSAVVFVLVGRYHALDYETGIPRRLSIIKPNIKMLILKRASVSN